MASTSTRFCVFAIAIIYQINSQSIPCNGNCNCPTSPTGTTCTLNCDDVDQCKHSTLICRVGDACIINCIGSTSCEDSVINATGALNISVNCNGVSSCKGNSVIDGRGASDVSVNCEGENACEGNTIINCGTSSCAILCGTSTSCIDTTVYAPHATSLSCTGSCDSMASIPAPFTITTHSPTVIPTKYPSKNPISPTNIPTLLPTITLIFSPTKNPTNVPSKNSITIHPSNEPSFIPTQITTATSRPTSSPTVTLTTSTSITANPSITPTISPTKSPTNNPSILPTRNISSITSTAAPTKSPATAYPTISSSENPTINPSVSSNESHTINQTKVPSVNPSISSTNKSILTTTEKLVQENNENDISYLVLGMPLWMNAVIGFGIVCCLLIVLMLCIRKRNKKSYVNFESPDVNENDQQIVVRTDTHETHSNNSIKAEFCMGDLGASNSNLCEKNTFERGLMNNCVVSDILMEDIVDNMDTRGNIEMSNNNNNVAAQGESMDIQDSIDDINNNVNDGQVMLQEIIKMANDTKVTAEGDNNI